MKEKHRESHRNRNLAIPILSIAMMFPMAGTANSTPATPTSPPSPSVTSTSLPSSPESEPASPDPSLGSANDVEDPTYQGSGVASPEEPQSPITSSTMPPRPETDSEGAAQPQRNAQARALPGCADYWNPELNSWFMVCGRILDKYNQLGGPGGFLGLPTSNEITNPGNTGKRTSFRNNSSIYWSPATDAHQIGGEIGAQWANFGYEGGMLGYPKTDELPTFGATGRFNEFQNSNSIYYSSVTGARQIGGEIRTKWFAVGGPGGSLGFPDTNEGTLAQENGRYNHFKNTNSPFYQGSIYWTAGTGAHPVSGEIRSSWSAMSWEAGRYGYPTTDQRATGCSRQSQTFQHGVILTNPFGVTQNVDDDSVDGRRIAYKIMGSSASSEIGATIANWNALGEIDIAPTGLFEITDVIFSDVNRSDETYNAQWINLPSYIGSDRIELNIARKGDVPGGWKYYDIVGILGHEVGHALGLQHHEASGCQGQVMSSGIANRQGVYTPQNLDKDVYYYLWMD